MIWFTLCHRDIAAIQKYRHGRGERSEARPPSETAQQFLNYADIPGWDLFEPKVQSRWVAGLRFAHRGHDGIFGSGSFSGCHTERLQNNQFSSACV